MFFCDCVSVWNVGARKNTFATPSAYGTDRANVVDVFLRKSRYTECYISDVFAAGDKMSYWMVDFAGLYKIRHVNITSRVDCCGQWTNKRKKLIYNFVDNKWTGPAARSSPVQRAISK